MKANKKLFMGKDTRAQVGIGTLIIFIAMVLVAAVAAAVLIQTSGVLQQKAQATGKQATQEVSSNLIIKSIEGIRAKNSSTVMSDTIDMLKVRVGLNVGSAPVDVNQVVISVTDGTTANNLVYANNDKSYRTSSDSAGEMDFFGSSASTNVQLLLFNSTTIDSTSNNNTARYFVAEKIRDEDTSFSQTNPVMNTGDLITVYIATVSSDATAATYRYASTYEATVDPANGTMRDSGINLVPRTTVNIIMTPEAGAATTADFVTPSSYGVKEAVQLYP